MQDQSTSTARKNARTLRREMTDSERKLWSGLRMDIADFVCLDPKLIIELDGSQHQAREAYDARRDEFFRAQGFEVLRFASNEPFINFDGVLQAIVNRLNELALLAPIPAFPQWGKE
ncbi:DUF559 domain-containing protein [Variovorax paradoxus]|nr:DUF559 domain-containing protein [Variovorax paradoxus]